MDGQLHLNSDQLRIGLAQILQSYSRAGIKRFNGEAGGRLAPEILAQLTASGAGAPSADVAAPIARATSHAPAMAAAGRAAPDEAALTAASPAVVHSPVHSPSPPVGHWQMPSLSDQLRQRQLQEIDEQVRACRKCNELVCYRRQTVFGEGNVRPRVCFYGEAPGADEDAQGRPFVGAAGKLLTDIIRAMQLTREEVYILNSLKCRPPQNRMPLPEEVENCRPFALTQLELLQPEFIILLGAVAVRSVLQSNETVGRLRGRFHHFQGARVLVTYHPAYLLRNAEAKKLVWADVQMVMRELGLNPKR